MLFFFSVRGLTSMKTVCYSSLLLQSTVGTYRLDFIVFGDILWQSGEQHDVLGLSFVIQSVYLKQPFFFHKATKSALELPVTNWLQWKNTFKYAPESICLESLTSEHEVTRSLWISVLARFLSLLCLSEKWSAPLVPRPPSVGIPPLASEQVGIESVIPAARWSTVRN